MTTVADVATARRCLDSPTLSVFDNRGLLVRTVQYNRTAAEKPLDERISQQTYAVLGHLSSSIDPRLLAEQQLDSSVPPNFRYISSLSGQPLKAQSQDAGEWLTLYDSEGGVIWQQDARGQQLTRTFDPLHRLTSITELADGASRVSERLIYADSSVSTDANLYGQLLQAYSPAGTTLTDAYSITGQLLRSQQQFLQDEVLHSDWAGSDPSVWNAALTPETFTTHWAYNALAQAVQALDARGNQQCRCFNIAGQLAASELQQVGRTASQAVLRSINYSAAGQVQHKEAGNGVVTDYVYEPQTQRLSRLTTTRPAQSRRSTQLQALSYQYDPVGNLLAINDNAKAIRFTRNQRVAAVSQYQYDALYQLCQASGRENANAGQQTQALPPAIVPLRQESGELTNYIRTYTYDRGNNLIAIQHVGQHPYTQHMVVASTSNRAVQQTIGLKRQDVDSFFDTCGNLLQLTPGQPLSWDSRNQLLRTTQVVRIGPDDDEVYWYDSQGQRATKLGTTLTSGTTHTKRVRYLPGLELRQTERTLSEGGSTSVTEILQVIQLAATGRQALRVLHWEQGKPAEIENDQFRYSLEDQVGSSLLEVDQRADILTWEEYYAFGGTAVWSARNETETRYKFARYSGKERDLTGLYYYGFRYYAPWLGRWLNPDPAGTIDGLNLFCMVGNNPITLHDPDGLAPKTSLESASEIPDPLRSQNNKGLVGTFYGVLRGIRRFFMDDLGSSNSESLTQADEIPAIGDMEQQRTREIQKLFVDERIVKLIAPAALEANDILENLKARIKVLDETVKKIPYPFEGTNLKEAADKLTSVNINEKNIHAEVMELMGSMNGDISAEVQDELDTKKRLHMKIVLMEKTEGGERAEEGGGSAFKEKRNSFPKDGVTRGGQLKNQDFIKKSILPKRASYYPSSVRAGFAAYACSPRNS